MVAVGLAFAGGLAAILALAALLAAGAAFAQPAEFALVPAAAGPERLAAASGRMEAARYAGHTAGPLLAGVLVARAAPRSALFANAASFAVVVVVAALLRSAATRSRRRTRTRARRAAEPARRPRAEAGGARRGVGALLFISASMTARSSTPRT